MTRAARVTQATFLLALPFVVFHWLVPGMGSLTLGNDYPRFSFLHQLELQFSLVHGSFPLFCPGFIEGNSCAALTGQLLHPLPYLARLFPGYWRGDALTINTMLRLAELGVTQLLLFRFFERLNVRRAPAFIASFIAVYNLRMLDLFRYNSALEGYSAFIVLCSVLGFQWLEPARVIGPLAIAASTYLLATAGHPQTMHHGLLSACAVALLLPFVVAAIRRDGPVELRKAAGFWIRSAVFAGAGLLMAAPNLLPYYVEFVRLNASRVGNPYAFSIAYSDSWYGALGSFLSPLAADVHGAFGGSGLMVAVLLFPVAMAMSRSRPRAIAIAWSCGAVTFLVGLGATTPLHRWFWSFVPFASSLRVPGRVSMILPVLSAFVSSWFLQEDRGPIAPISRRPAAILGVLGALALVGFQQSARSIHESSYFTPGSIAALPAWVGPTLLGMGMVTLAALAATGMLRSGSSREAAMLVLCVTVVLETAVALRYGTWVEARTPSPTLASMDEARRETLTYQGVPGFGLETGSVTRQVRRSVLDPWLARFYRSWESVAGNEEAYVAMAMRHDAHTLIVEEPEGSSRGQPRSGPPDRVSLAHSSFNLFRFVIQAGAEGFMTVSFPYFEGFTARVDGSTAPVRRANGYQIAVPVPAGSHVVELKYWSAATNAGVLVGLLTLAALFGWALSRAAWRPAVRIAIVASGVALLALVYAAWRKSLYTGENLNHQYEWSSDQLPPSDDLAYGRPTAMSSQLSSYQELTIYYSGRGVDGSLAEPCFSTSGDEMNPWWQVDLGEPRSLGIMRLRGPWPPSPSPYLGTSMAPLYVYTSEDGLAFRLEKVFTGATGEDPISIDLRGATARLVRLALIGARSPLSFCEVEIFPPGKRL